MALRVGGSAIEGLVGTLLVRLLDDRVPGLQEGSQLLKALNVLMLKILENSARSLTFAALLGLLRRPPASLRRVAGGGAEAEQKFSDLVVKCLIKLTKALGTFVAARELDVPALLGAVHCFFGALGVEEIRRRGQEDDKPLRMVKTILHEVCKVEGHATHGHLATACILRDSDSIIHNYVDLNLQTLQAAGLIKAPPGPPPPLRVPVPDAQPTAASPEPRSPSPYRSTGNTPRPQPLSPKGETPAAALGATATTPYMTPGSNTPTPPGSAAATPGRFAASPGAVPTTEAKQQLAAIFKKIGDKNRTERGLEELYFFQTANAEIDISFHLSKTSDAFRRYIQSGLDKVAARQQQAALLAAQPPPPPQQPSPGEGRAPEDSSAALQERMERLKGRFASGPPGADDTAAPPADGRVGSHNLDELRERMKQIQSQLPQ